MKTWAEALFDLLMVHLPTIDDMKRFMTIVACLKADGNQEVASELLGVSRRTIFDYRKENSDCWAEWLAECVNVLSIEATRRDYVDCVEALVNRRVA